ncbi:hypothetical protein C1645_736967 [Glomus cerebriforme]|uniref:Uncharacterized protein n=1 Tax=Glomus cerebriforme TaxID=658196 RepID=A0A397T1D7_9GLOM|nr:hypothetical protein C1645_736967 [Glomus cerebriforme]
MDTWSNELETRLLEIYERKDVTDIFWGRPIKEHLTESTHWYIYVITRSYTNTEILNDGQIIRYIAEEDGFAKFDDDSSLNLPKIPQDLQDKFDEALDNELGPSFREIHYNLVGMCTGYKRIGGKITSTPAILLYVKQKGILRRGSGGIFPDKICGYPVDIVEACIARSCCGIGQENCQRYQNEITLGSSIGIGINEEEKTLGTLGIVVCEKELPKRVGFVSCEHVLKFNESNNKKRICQPSSEDLLDASTRRLKTYLTEKDEYEHEIENLKREINYIKERDPTLAIYNIGTYEFGMRKNYFSEKHKKLYGIDAAYGVFNSENRSLHSRKFSIFSEYFKKAGLYSNFSLTGIYNHDELKSFDDSNRVVKIGRTTGLTLGKLVPCYTTVAIELKSECIEHAKKIGDKVPYKSDRQEFFISYMKSQLDSNIIDKRKKCFPVIWFDRQLAFVFKSKEFDYGDSGASVLDERGKAFGMLHAKFETNYFSYGIASPYFAILEALNLNIVLSPKSIKPTCN